MFILGLRVYSSFFQLVHKENCSVSASNIYDLVPASDNFLDL